MSELVLKILICLIAGLFAGVGTGFVGMSAAVAITPLIMGFLGVDHYPATAIALASDVLASLIAAIMYHRHKNTNLKGCIPMVMAVLFATFAGTVAGYFIPSNLMGYGTIATVFIMGLKLLFFPTRKNKETKAITTKHKVLVEVLLGCLIGFVCGFVGAGGGMMLLLVLTVVLGYEMHKAVGTSVSIMTFSAFVGSGFHILFDYVIMKKSALDVGQVDWIIFGLCVIFTFLFSLLASKFANKMSEKALNLVSGIMLIGISATVFAIDLPNMGNIINTIRIVVAIVIDAIGVFSILRKLGKLKWQRRTK